MCYLKVRSCVDKVCKLGAVLVGKASENSCRISAVADTAVFAYSYKLIVHVLIYVYTTT